ncbi:MAG: response regulator [Ignavibacteria bacterium]|jgi:CheY-like chemotaxis protein|nr:response regulator [Ignavibacteria bacterium]MCU7504735.1 response regulator [Ignavibacteria bacterium]MCU7516337.1 response regulator [Ignavibacteria bacterium]
MNKKKVEVLLVEDNPGDVTLIREILLENAPHISLNVIMNGEDALNYLFRKEEFSDATVPALMILDLNLPKKSGKEILEEIKGEKGLCEIPIIIYSSADIDENIFTNKKYNIKYYLVKPIALEDYISSIEFIKSYISKLMTE